MHRNNKRSEKCYFLNDFDDDDVNLNVNAKLFWKRHTKEEEDVALMENNKRLLKWKALLY